jgi:hypothetical protein
MKQEETDIYTENSQSRHSNSSQASRPVQQEAPHCANCDIAILWSPTVVDGNSYCCTGCAAGGPCCCDYSQYASVKISGVIHYGPDEKALKESFNS